MINSLASWLFNERTRPDFLQCHNEKRKTVKVYTISSFLTNCAKATSINPLYYQNETQLEKDLLYHCQLLNPFPLQLSIRVHKAVIYVC